MHTSFFFLNGSIKKYNKKWYQFSKVQKNFRKKNEEPKYKRDTCK